MAAMWRTLGLAMLAGTLGAHEAHADDLGAMAEILPLGDVVGDGQSVATAHVLVRDASGEGLGGLKLKGSADAATVDEILDLGGGLYAVRFTAGTVDSLDTVTLEVTGRTAGGPISMSRDVVVHPAAGMPIGAAVNPSYLVLGQDPEASLSLDVKPVRGVAAAVDDLVIKVSSGSIGTIVDLGGGRFTARYEAPQVNYPHLAIITVTDRRDPDGTLASIAVPLHGKVAYPVTVAPNANVILRVAGREYGPVSTGATGRVSVPIVVPPGVATAEQVVVTPSGVERTDLDLKVPDVKRLQVFPMPASVPSDARAKVPVQVLVLDAKGQPDTSARLDLAATAGRVTRPEHVANGVYRAEYVPPDGRTTMAATLTATVPGSTVQTDTVELTLIPAMPVRLALSPEPEILGAGATQLRVFAQLKAADGSGLPGRTLRFDAFGAALEGTVADLKGGDYRAEFAADPASSAFVRATAISPVSDNALAHVVVLAQRDTLPADASTTEAITVITTDRFGYPVPGVPVELVLTGDGRLPTEAVTDATGVAEVFYTTGREPGLIGIEARALGHVGALGLLQGADDAPLLPPSGTDADRSVADALTATQASVLVRREGASAVQAAATAASGDDGAISVLAVSTQPRLVAPGGTVTVEVQASTAAGGGVSGVPLDFFATGGARFGEVTDVGGGTYRTTLKVPEDAAGSVKISVLGPGGSPTSVVELPVVATAEGEDTVWGGSEPAAIVPTEEVDPALAVTETPAGDPPWEHPEPPIKRPSVRIKLAATVASYAYSQEPSDAPGPLLPSTLAWGGGAGRAAVPVGGEARIRVAATKFPWVGADAQVRLSRYTVSSSAFTGDAGDTLVSARVNLLVRAPIKIRSNELSFGARVGFRYDDFITFRGCSEPGCTVEYGPLGLPGLGAGLEIGAEFDRLFLVASADAGFAYATQPYAANADLDLGVHIVDNFFVVAGFGYQMRRTEVIGADSDVQRGSLSDQQLLGSIGVGAAF